MNLLPRAAQCSSSSILLPRLGYPAATLATKSSNQKQYLVNEALVQAIRKRACHIPPQEIQVRLLQHPNSTQLLSLPQAVQLSVQQKLDLIGISLQQEIPVIRMENWKSFLYKQEKESSHPKRKTIKEIHLQPKIADHDLERKLQQVTKFLEKGHICVLKMPLLLLDTVLQQLPSFAELMHPPQIEGQKALIRVHAK
ncbi:hypothetical protein FisN_12Hh059 [Fistulifera solaris]|uniref:Translation initiation factor 3 N-terminal domain-containing protein n=1 Tax=Fistulifera solaris TaxID=1519565 RepID=A0A1Z5K1P2_FISSO|nr:hypothetical protein FisN_12Hh059 [Fistulifera solaris]|eukprot:GAX20214.1 hypothetical protein FisN_12Hh059 [Fistulifera solaris]